MVSSEMPWIRLAVPVKYFSMTDFCDAHRFENLRPAVALHGGDAHLAGHFNDALVGGLDVIFLGGFQSAILRAAFRLLMQMPPASPAPDTG